MTRTLNTLPYMLIYNTSIHSPIKSNSSSISQKKQIYIASVNKYIHSDITSMVIVSMCKLACTKVKSMQGPGKSDVLFLVFANMCAHSEHGLSCIIICK